MENENVHQECAPAWVAWTGIIVLLIAAVINIYFIVSFYREVNNVGKVDKAAIKEYMVKAQPINPGAMKSDSLYRILHSGLDSLLDNSVALSTAEKQDYDRRLLWLVALCGALGSFIAIIASFTNFFGNQKLSMHWLPWYVAKPFIGAGLAMVGYFGLRGGFMTGIASAGDLNLPGILTIASFMGLFSDIATLKLKEIFEVIFHPKDERKGKLSHATTPQTGGTATPGTPAVELAILDFNPKVVKPDTETEIKIIGHNIPDDIDVKYGTEVVPHEKIAEHNGNLIRFTLPKIPAGTKSVKLAVYDPKQNKDIAVGTVGVK